MAKVTPFYSIKRDVYHDNSLCTESNNIEKENRRAGTTGKTKCKHCRRLSK